MNPAGSRLISFDVHCRLALANGQSIIKKWL
jgi:hypothetical protein